MHERISRRVARLLAHPAGFLTFNLFTACWFFLPVGAAWSIGGTAAALAAGLVCVTGYLDIVTWFSTATQFTLAFQNDEAARKLDEALAQIDRVIDENYAATQALLLLAENELNLQEALAAQSSAIIAALAELRR